MVPWQRSGSSASWHNYLLGSCIVLALSGCTPNQGDFCQNAKPILYRSNDRLTEETFTAITVHNQKGMELCGWVPPRPLLRALQSPDTLR